MSVFNSQPNNIFFSKMMMVLILMSSTFIIMQTTLPCLSCVVICTTPHSVPTPTVCGHAEACPSTTYAKWAIPALWSAVAARWAGVIPQQKNRPAGRVLPAVQNQNPPSRKRHVKRAFFYLTIRISPFFACGPEMAIRDEVPADVLRCKCFIKSYGRFVIHLEG